MSVHLRMAELPGIIFEAADYRHYSLADKQGGNRSALLLTCVCLALQSIWISQSAAAASLRGMHPLSIQYYDSLSFNCFLRGPCSPYLGKPAALPLMHLYVLTFSVSLELLGEAVCLWAATLKEQSAATRVGNMQVFNVSLKEGRF